MMLTVFKANKDALRFYQKLRFSVDESSPSRCGVGRHTVAAGGDGGCGAGDGAGRRLRRPIACPGKEAPAPHGGPARGR